MAMSDRIEAFITELLKEEEALEIGRNELAGIFNCVPSQINYVISTRFGPDKGYIVESRRGGGGYIRIKKTRHEPFEFSEQLFKSTADEITADKAAAMTAYLEEAGRITPREHRIIDAAASAVGQKKHSDKARAEILKSILEEIL